MLIKKNKIFSLLLLFIIYFSACKECSKKVPCPGYNDALLDAWFPYKDKQKLIFKSSTNALDTFDIRLTDSTTVYESFSNSGCPTTKSFSSIKIDTSSRSAFTLSLNSNSNNDSRSVNISFYKNYFSASSFSELGFLSFSFYNGTTTGNPTSIQSFSNYLYNGNIYNNVQVVFTDTILNKSAGVYKFIYAKNYGIISYETNPSGTVWLKQ